MCWGTPARVVSVSGPTAIVDFGGVRKEVLVGLEEVLPKDLVMVHAGVVIGKLSLEDLMINVELYREMLVQELLSSGVEEREAQMRAKDEMDRFLASLGIHG